MLNVLQKLESESDSFYIDSMPSIFNGALLKWLEGWFTDPARFEKWPEFFKYVHLISKSAYTDETFLESISQILFNLANGADFTSKDYVILNYALEKIPVASGLSWFEVFRFNF